MPGKKPSKQPRENYGTFVSSDETVVVAIFAQPFHETFQVKWVKRLASNALKILQFSRFKLMKRSTHFGGGFNHLRGRFVSPPFPRGPM